MSDKETTGDGQPTTDDALLNKEQSVDNENTGEEYSSENSISESGELNTHNSQLTTQSMEVHHHPDLHHKKKKFKEYLLEFIMIFLAVTMGFFAESYREHLVENRKEKEIITALYTDVKEDTANLNTIISRFMPEHGGWADTLEFYITSLPIKGNDKKFARALMNATNWNFYSPPQVSLEILKNSGTFNLVKSEKLKSEIINFNGLVNTYVNYSQFILATEHSVDTATAGLINRVALRKLIETVYIKTNAEYGSITEDDIPENTILKTYDKNIFLNYMNKLDAMDYLLNDLLGLYKKVLKEETTLLHILNKEYHLENE